MAGRKVDRVIVHCSDTPTGRDIGLKEINQWHEERGFSPTASGLFCGYHWIIRINGVIEMGRKTSEAGIHVAGHNRSSIGICLVGRGNYSEDQLASLLYLLGQTLDAYNLEPKNVFGHYEFNQGKQCPMINMEALRDSLEMYLTERGKANGSAN